MFDWQNAAQFGPMPSGPLAACEVHNWSPPRGPRVPAAKGLCPHCQADWQLRYRREYEGETYRHGDAGRQAVPLVSDGPVVTPGRQPNDATKLLYARWLAEDAERREVERDALAYLERKVVEREQRERKNRPRYLFSKFEDGEYKPVYSTRKRRDRSSYTDESGTVSVFI